MRRSSWTYCIVCVMLLLVSDQLTSSVFAQTLPVDQQKSGNLTLAPFISVVAKTRASIVEIKNAKGVIALGTVVDPNGVVVTKASQLTDYVVCKLSDGRTLQPQVIGIDKQYDVALLKVSATNLPTIQWKSDVALKRGQWLATPGIRKLPLAVGVVSVEQRAIPKRSGVLGIQIAQDERGPKITLVFPKSSAERAGLKVGDVVTSISGTEVKSREQLVMTVRKKQSGEQLVLKILRGETEMIIKAILGEPPAKMLNRGARQNRMGGTLSIRRAGFPQVVQHDTVLKPEQCGGVVVDLTGSAVGLNIARAGRTESYTVPAKKMIEIIKTLRSAKNHSAKHLRTFSDGPVAPALPK